MRHDQQAGESDLTVIIMSKDPELLREAHVIAEGATEAGFEASVLAMEPAASDEDIVARLNERGARVAAMAVGRNAIHRCIGASKAIVEDAARPVLLFGKDFTSELERWKVPAEAATGVVVGPASATVVDFLKSLGGGGMVPVAGLDRLDGDFRPRPPQRHLAGPRFPRFDSASIIRFQREGMPIRIGHGCTRRCAFCGEQPREGNYRSRPAHDIVDEIIHHRQENRIHQFEFCDLVINADLEKLEAVCDLLLEQHLDVVWRGRLMVDHRMPRALYRKMRVAGCVGLDFETFSASDKILEALGAGFTADHATSALERASSAGIDCWVSLLVGLPGETEVEFGETCTWLHKNRYRICQVRDIKPFVLSERSILMEDHVRYGITVPKEDPCNEWHDGGFNTSAYRAKRAQELVVFVEDGLHLEVVGDRPEVSWDAETRGKMCERLFREAHSGVLETGRFVRENLHLSGVVQRSDALAGPPSLEIDLTNNCNLHCAGCWIHSFMMGDDRLAGEKRRATLEYDKLEDLILSAKRMGTKRIQLSGAGDPYMHPRIEDVLTLIKNEGFELNVITNFTLVDEKRARRLVDLGVDSVTVSLWAGTSETYAKTHPTSKEKLFDQILRVLEHLTWYRRDTNALGPRIKIYNVISNLNCHEIHEMIDVARQVGADLIEFTPIDIIKGKTDALALNEADNALIVEQLSSLRDRGDYLQRTVEEVTEGRVPGLDEQGEFARFLQHHRLATDFQHKLDDIRCWEAFCRRGIHCCRVYEEIHRDSAIFFGFPEEECDRCMAKNDCSVNPITHTVRAPYLSLQGFGSFWRRVKEGGEGGRDTQIVDQIPCSIGYTYARIQATGHVIPCCKAADFPLGNIMEQSFEEIWHSPGYQEFRDKAMSLPKSDSYFDPMECYKVCDNLGHNMDTNERVENLSEAAMEELMKSK